MYQADVPAQIPVGQSVWTEKARAKNAANHAKKLYPGPVGDFPAAEFTALADIGLRFDQISVVKRCIDAVLASPLPEQASV
jgi:hypothetical protein